MLRPQGAVGRRSRAIEICTSVNSTRAGPFHHANSDLRDSRMKPHKTGPQPGKNYFKLSEFDVMAEQR